MNVLANPIVLLVAANIICLVGCQTARQNEFKDVQVGMNKNAVLAAAGNPNVARRWKGMDRWIYKFEGAETREVHFLDGKAVYVGDEVKPPVSASEQDHLNEASNTKESQRVDSETASSRAESARIADPTPTTDEERIKVAPTFVPIN
jgi:outer membrane protein assembly factor BamE (lipoprotein component of BamABCDE complex)